MGKDTFWFRHDSNAKDDPKCMLLIEQLGLEGYGIFWILIELLRDQPGYRYPLNLIPSIARKYNTTPEKVKVVVSQYGLFSFDQEEFFFSFSLRERMEALDNYRNALSEAGKRGVQARLKGGLSTPQASRVEKSREELNGDKDTASIIFDLTSNPEGNSIVVKESGLIAVRIFQQSFEKYMTKTFPFDWEQQKMTVLAAPPIKEFFKKKNGDIFNDTRHLWSSFKKLWIESEVKKKPNPGKL